MNTLKFDIVKKHGALIQELDGDSDSIGIELVGVNDECTIIVTHPDGKQFYRTSDNHTAQIPAPKTSGVMKVTIHYHEDYIPCTAVYVQVTDGKLYFSYSEQDIYDTYRELLHKMEDYSEQVRRLNDRIIQLSKKVEMLTEGYDID